MLIGPIDSPVSLTIQRPGPPATIVSLEVMRTHPNIDKLQPLRPGLQTITIDELYEARLVATFIEVQPALSTFLILALDQILIFYPECNTRTLDPSITNGLLNLRSKRPNCEDQFIAGKPLCFWTVFDTLHRDFDMIFHPKSVNGTALDAMWNQKKSTERKKLRDIFERIKTLRSRYLHFEPCSRITLLGLLHDICYVLVLFMGISVDNLLQDLTCARDLVHTTISELEVIDSHVGSAKSVVKREHMYWVAFRRLYSAFFKLK